MNHQPQGRIAAWSGVFPGFWCVLLTKKLLQSKQRAKFVPSFIYRPSDISSQPTGWHPHRPVPLTMESAPLRVLRTTVLSFVICTSTQLHMRIARWNRRRRSFSKDPFAFAFPILRIGGGRAMHVRQKSSAAFEISAARLFAAPVVEIHSAVGMWRAHGCSPAVAATAGFSAGTGLSVERTHSSVLQLCGTNPCWFGTQCNVYRTARGRALLEGRSAGLCGCGGSMRPHLAAAMAHQSELSVLNTMTGG